MTPDELKEIRTMGRQINDIHAVLFGVEGQGGLHRQVQEHEKAISNFKQDKARVLGIVAGVSVIISLIGAKIMSLFGGGK